MVVWVLKIRHEEKYDCTQTFSSREEAQAYINRTDRHYYIPAKAEIKPKLED